MVYTYGMSITPVSCVLFTLSQTINKRIVNGCNAYIASTNMYIKKQNICSVSDFLNMEIKGRLMLNWNMICTTNVCKRVQIWLVRLYAFMMPYFCGLMVVTCHPPQRGKSRYRPYRVESSINNVKIKMVNVYTCRLIRFNMKYIILFDGTTITVSMARRLRVSFGVIEGFRNF